MPKRAISLESDSDLLVLLDMAILDFKAATKIKKDQFREMGWNLDSRRAFFESAIQIMKRDQHLDPSITRALNKSINKYKDLAPEKQKEVMISGWDLGDYNCFLASAIIKCIEDIEELDKSWWLRRSIPLPW